MSLGSRAVLMAVGALVIGVAFWFLQFSTGSICCGDYDAYYHFRWSQMLWDGLRTGNFPPAFNALPLTTLNPRDYVDHHFLFHVFQIPFTMFPDFERGAKVGTWLFACLAVFSCYWLVLRYRLSHPLVWLVAVLGSSAPFLYRIQMGKAMSVSIVMLVAGIHLLFQRKYLWLLPLAFVFTLTYDMVFLLLVAAGFWLLVVVWNERAPSRAVMWALAGLGLVLAGILLGYVINPYFPHNIRLTYEHLLMKATPKDFKTAVGTEWYPYDTWEFLGNCGLAVVAMVAGYIAFRDAGRKEQQHAFFFLLFSTFLMLVNARWRRFAEYFPPFAVLFAAFALQPFIGRLRARMSPRPEGAVPDDIETQGPAARPTGRERDSWWEHEAAVVGIVIGASLYATAVSAPWNFYLKAGAVAAAGLVGVASYLYLRGWARATVMAATLIVFGVMGRYHLITSNDIAGMAGPGRYRGGMEWVNKNASKGEVIFNTDWDDFPKLFFYNPDLAYISGLDPTYLHDRDERLAELYARITIGRDMKDEEVENMGALIRDNFCVGEGEQRRCARYAFTDQDHGDFINNALDSGWFDLAYEDDDCAVFRIRDAKGDPWPDNKPPLSQEDKEGGQG